MPHTDQKTLETFGLTRSFITLNISKEVRAFNRQKIKVQNWLEFASQSTELVVPRYPALPDKTRKAESFRCLDIFFCGRRRVSTCTAGRCVYIGMIKHFDPFKMVVPNWRWARVRDINSGPRGSP